MIIHNAFITCSKASCDPYWEYLDRAVKDKRLTMPLSHGEFHDCHFALGWLTRWLERAGSCRDEALTQDLWPWLEAFAKRLLIPLRVAWQLRGRGGYVNN